MSEEKVLTLRGKKAVWAPMPAGAGPIDPKRLPEGYPYKEGVTIEWDGNTEGLDVVADTYYRVSDAIVSDEQIKVGVMADANGNEQAVTAIAPWDTFVSMGYVTEDVTSVESVVFVRKDGAVFQGVTFNKTGVYFMALVRKFTTETIHPMAPEFLPAGVGGGGGITLYCDDTPVDVSAEAPESFPSANTSYTIYKDNTFTTALTVEEKKTLHNKCLEVLKNGGHVSACQKTSNGITYYPNGVCRIEYGVGLQIIWETSDMGLQFLLMDTFAMVIGLGD